MQLRCLVTILLSAVLFYSCGPEFAPAGPQVDFTVGELFSAYALGKDTVVLSDTVLTKNRIILEATGDYDSYQWQIGKDKREFDTRRVELFFDRPVPNLFVKLTVHSGLSTADSLQVATKTIVVTDYWENPVMGVFSGANQSEPNNSFDVKIEYDGRLARINVLNINKGCDPVVPAVGIQGFDIAVGYKTLFFSSGFYYQSCSDPSGWIKVDRWGNGITIDYSIGTGSGEHLESDRIKLHYTGNRKQ